MKTKIAFLFLICGLVAFAAYGQNSGPAPFLDTKNYAFSVEMQTGTAIAGRPIELTNPEDGIFRIGPFSPTFLITDDGQVAFTGAVIRPRGVAPIPGLFTSQAVLALQGEALDGIPIERITEFAVGGKSIGLIASYSRGNCAACHFTGVFIDGRLRYEIQAPAPGITGLAMDSTGNFYARIFRLAETGLPALLRNGQIALKSGDKLGANTVADIMVPRQTSEGVAILLSYRDARGIDTMGRLFNESMLVPIPNGTFAFTLKNEPISDADVILHAGDRRLVQERSGRMDFMVLNESLFTFITTPVPTALFVLPGMPAPLVNPIAVFGGKGMVANANGVSSLTDIPKCCRFAGRSVINRRGDILFEVLSQDASIKTQAIIKAVVKS